MNRTHVAALAAVALIAIAYPNRSIGGPIDPNVIGWRFAT